MSTDSRSGVRGTAEPRFERIEAAPAYLRVAEAIEHKIVTGQLKPGEHIGTEAVLCEEFGVNRSTVREGIRLLEQSGLLRRDQSRRLYASLPRYNNLATRVGRALVLHQTTFREVWEASMGLETAVVELAAQRVTAEDLRNLDELLQRSEAALSDPVETTDLDSEFHAAVAAVAQNRVLQLAREPASLLFTPTLRIILDKVEAAGRRNLDAHRKIAEALRKHDPAEAREWMQKHLVDWRRGFEQSGRSLDEPVERTMALHMELGNTYRR